MGLGSLFRRGKKQSKKEEKVEDCHIDINTDDCDGCEKCAIACPNNVLMITDSVHDYVDSVVGIPLPQFGAPYVDYKINSIAIWSNKDDDFIYEDFDVSKDSFPTGLEDSEWFEISFTYYGANIDAAKE